VIDRALKGIRLYDQPDVLDANITTAGQTTITYLGVLSGWGVTTVAEINNELMLVTSVDYGNKIATVVRGWLGTTAQASVTAGAPIYLNPRLMRSDFLALINECLDDLMGHDLYATDVASFVYDPISIGYNLDSSLSKVLRVDAQTDAQAGLWEPIYDWHVQDNADTTEFASSKALMLRASLPFGAKVRVVYSKPFTSLADDTEDLEANAGMQDYMTDLVYYYIMRNLMVDEERRRSQMESAQNHQRSQDSPPFLSLRTGEWYGARYLDKIRTARARLRKETAVPMGAGYGS